MAAGAAAGVPCPSAPRRRARTGGGPSREQLGFVGTMDLLCTCGGECWEHGAPWAGADAWRRPAVCRVAALQPKYRADSTRWVCLACGVVKRDLSGCRGHSAVCAGSAPRKRPAPRTLAPPATPVGGAGAAVGKGTPPPGKRRRGGGVLTPSPTLQALSPAGRASGAEEEGGAVTAASPATAMPLAAALAATPAGVEALARSCVAATVRDGAGALMWRASLTAALEAVMEGAAAAAGILRRALWGAVASGEGGLPPPATSGAGVDVNAGVTQPAPAQALFAGTPPELAAQHAALVALLHAGPGGVHAGALLTSTAAVLEGIRAAVGAAAGRARASASAAVARLVGGQEGGAAEGGLALSVGPVASETTHSVVGAPRVEVGDWVQARWEGADGEAGVDYALVVPARDSAGSLSVRHRALLAEDPLAHALMWTEAVPDSPGLLRLCATGKCPYTIAHASTVLAAGPLLLRADVAATAAAGQPRYVVGHGRGEGAPTAAPGGRLGHHAAALATVASGGAALQAALSATQWRGVERVRAACREVLVGVLPQPQLLTLWRRKRGRDGAPVPVLPPMPCPSCGASGAWRALRDHGALLHLLGAGGRVQRVHPQRWACTAPECTRRLSASSPDLWEGLAGVDGGEEQRGITLSVPHLLVAGVRVTEAALADIWRAYAGMAAPRVAPLVGTLRGAVLAAAERGTAQRAALLRDAVEQAGVGLPPALRTAGVAMACSEVAAAALQLARTAVPARTALDTLLQVVWEGAFARHIPDAVRVLAPFASHVALDGTFSLAGRVRVWGAGGRSWRVAGVAITVTGAGGLPLAPPRLASTESVQRLGEALLPVLEARREACDLATGVARGPPAFIAVDNPHTMGRGLKHIVASVFPLSWRTVVVTLDAYHAFARPWAALPSAGVHADAPTLQSALAELVMLVGQPPVGADKDAAAVPPAPQLKAQAEWLRSRDAEPVLEAARAAAAAWLHRRQPPPGSKAQLAQLLRRAGWALEPAWTAAAWPRGALPAAPTPILPLCEGTGGGHGGVRMGTPMCMLALLGRWVGLYAHRGPSQCWREAAPPAQQAGQGGPAAAPLPLLLGPPSDAVCDAEVGALQAVFAAPRAEAGVDRAWPRVGLTAPPVPARARAGGGGTGTPVGRARAAVRNLARRLHHARLAGASPAGHAGSGPNEGAHARNNTLMRGLGAVSVPVWRRLVGVRFLADAANALTARLGGHASGDVAPAAAEHMLVGALAGIATGVGAEARGHPLALSALWGRLVGCRPAQYGEMEARAEGLRLVSAGGNAVAGSGERQAVQDALRDAHDAIPGPHEPADTVVAWVAHRANVSYQKAKLLLEGRPDFERLLDGLAPGAQARQGAAAEESWESQRQGHSAPP